VNCPTKFNRVEWVFGRILRATFGDLPGDPVNRERAGTTVFGCKIVLSAILAQSLMIVNFP
jgi:hypothetical protein